MRYIATLIALVAIASVASADIVSAPSALAPGNIKNQIQVDTGGSDWLSAKLLVDVGDGDVWKTVAFAWYGPASTVGVFNDSTEIQDGLGGQCSVLAPVDFGVSTIQWDNDGIAIEWFTTDTTNIGAALEIAKITLDDEASGTWRLGYALQDGTTADISGTVVGGYMIPEPATMLVMIAGGLGILARRRRK